MSTIGSIGSSDITALYQSLFSSIDTDSDDSISESEFSTAVSASGSDASSDDVSSMFNKLDTDGDGVVSSSEMMSALKSAGESMQASMPPPPPPPPPADEASSSDDSSILEEESLTDDEASTVDSILSNYDSSNLTAEDVEAINQAISDAGISFNKALGDEIESQGFSIDTMMSLAGPPDETTSVSSTDATAEISVDTSAQSTLLSDLVKSLSSSDSDSGDQLTELLKSLSSYSSDSSDENDDYSMLSSLLSALSNSTQYSDSGSLSYSSSTLENLISTYA